MNSVQLIGNVGQDPELRYTTAGQAVVNLSLATNEVFTDKEGKRQKRTEWHRLVCWGKVAEIVNQYVRQGDKLGVEGKLQTRKWTDKQGEKRTSVEVTVLKVHLLGNRHAEEEAPPHADEDEPAF
jgi:single-strand DNA-binding protein